LGADRITLDLTGKHREPWTGRLKVLEHVSAPTPDTSAPPPPRR
jgi:hypothetical protein